MYDTTTLQLDDLIQNENIKADRFGLAAISYIFKAFGDTIRSKEYWPWGDKVNFPWDNDKDINYNLFDLASHNWETKGNISDLTRAALCIKEAQKRSNKDEEETTVDSHESISIKSLRKRLNKMNIRTKQIINNSEKIQKTSREVNEKINSIK